MIKRSRVFVVKLKCFAGPKKTKRSRGGSPGLVVMGGDSCSNGCEFESWHHILDGHFFTYFVVKIVMCALKDKINEKEAAD